MTSARPKVSSRPYRWIEAGQPVQQYLFEEDAERADDERRQNQRRPIAEAEFVEQETGAERAHHVQRAVREIDDVEHAEDHREAETEQRVERAVDQAEQQLLEQLLRRNAEDGHHASRPPAGIRSQYLLLDERALALGQRTERLVGGNGRDQLVIIPRIFRFPTASSPRTDRPGGSCGRRRGSCPCRTADRRSASPSSWRRPWRRHADCRRSPPAP